MGGGNKLMLAFPGYGKDASSLLPLEGSLGSHYTVACIEPPYHGQTRWNAGFPIEKWELGQLASTIAAELGYSKVSALLGYSMGGRFVLCLAEMLPDTETVFLLASDGWKPNYVYSFATRTTLGEKLFRLYVSGKLPILSILGLLKRTGLLRGGMYDFVKRKTDSEDKRQLLYERWIAARLILPDHKKLATRKNTRFICIAGKDDSIIPVRNARYFCKRVPHAELHVIPEGHHLVKTELNSLLSAVMGN